MRYSEANREELNRLDAQLDEILGASELLSWTKKEPEKPIKKLNKKELNTL